MFKSIAAWLIKPFGCFVSSIYENGFDYQLSREFQEIVKEREIENYKNAIEKLFRFIKDDALYNGYIKSDSQCLSEAHRLYLRAKKEKDSLKQNQN